MPPTADGSNTPSNANTHSERSPQSDRSKIPNRSKKKGALRKWVIVIAGILVSLLLFAMIRVQGFVSGREFSPITFSMRDFQFYEIPMLGLQITPIKRTGTTARTATYLRQKALINVPTPPDDVWHLVFLSRGFTGSTPADAQLLVEHLGLQFGGNDYWRKWSTDNPKHAQILWPLVQILAQRELYILMPPLFELAQRKQSAEQLSDNLNQSLRSQYLSLILDMRDSGRKQLATELLAEATIDFPDDDSLRKLNQSLSP